MVGKSIVTYIHVDTVMLLEKSQEAARCAAHELVSDEL